jgi:hypothetical protein
VTVGGEGPSTPPAEAAGSEGARLDIVVRALAVAFLACLAVSWKLWISTRLYPLVPLAGVVPPFPFPLDFIVLVALVGLLVGVVVRPRARLPVALVVGLVAVLFAQDRSRLWPSFYEFFLLFLILLSRRRDGGEAEAARVLAGLRFVMAAVYVWGGVQKVTPHFFHEEFPWFIRPLTSLLPFEVPYLPVLGATAAVCEILFGIGLLTRRFRGVALGEALAMHALILVCIGPVRSDWNDAAWVWSLATAALVWLLFRKAPPFSFTTMFAAPPRWNVPQAAAVVLVGILPALDNLNRWDSALSFNVYTGNVNHAFVLMPPDAVAGLPAEVAPHVSVRGEWAVLDVTAWSMREFHGGAYPGKPVFRAVRDLVCRLLPSRTVRLVIVEKAGWGFPKSTHVEACGQR